MTPEEQSEPAPAQTTPSSPEPTCGRRFSPPAAGTLQLTPRFPARAAAGDQVVTGEVEVSSSQAVRGVAAAAGEAFLVKDGVVVTTPLPQDAVGRDLSLEAGQPQRVPATVSLVSCDPAGGPLDPGEYELVVRFVLTPDGAEPEPAFGGPVPLRLG